MEHVFSEIRSSVESCNLQAGIRDVRLRAAVQLKMAEDGNHLTDADTGLELWVSADVAAFLRDIDNSVARNHPADVQVLLHLLASLGLLRPTTLKEARRLQGVYVLEHADEVERARALETAKRAFCTTKLHREHLVDFFAGGSGDFGRIPLMTKCEIRRHFPGGLTSDQESLPALLQSGDVVLASTSGTTGERLQVYSDTRIPRLPEDFPNFWHLQSLASDRPLRTAVLTSPACQGTCNRNRSSWRDRLAFEHTLFLDFPRNPFRMTAEQTRRVVDELSWFNPDFWYVNPVFLSAVSDNASQLGLSLPPPNAILAGYQFFPKCLRRAISRRFAAPVFDIYTATELGGSQIGIGCPYGNLHVRLDQVFVELLNAGQPVQPGEVGEVVVTTHNPVMPLVRYVTGDLAQFVLEPCRCMFGSSWPILRLEGRIRDTIVQNGVRITTRQVDDSLSSIDFKLYQLTELSPKRFRFEAVLSDSSDDWKAPARDALMTLLDPEYLSIERVSEVPLDSSQKFAFTVPRNVSELRDSVF